MELPKFRPSITCHPSPLVGLSELEASDVFRTPCRCGLCPDFPSASDPDITPDIPSYYRRIIRREDKPPKNKQACLRMEVLEKEAHRAERGPSYSAEDAQLSPSSTSTTFPHTDDIIDDNDQTTSDEALWNEQHGEHDPHAPPWHYDSRTPAARPSLDRGLLVVLDDGEDMFYERRGSGFLEEDDDDDGYDVGDGEEGDEEDQCLEARHAREVAESVRNIRELNGDDSVRAFAGILIRFEAHKTLQSNDDGSEYSEEIAERYEQSTTSTLETEMYTRLSCMTTLEHIPVAQK